jgi:glycosyltransferase involved in cell wall biosynthesis
MADEHIKISVIIPVYNAEEYLSTALDSVLNQTLREIELVCINDGSPDHSLDILRDYQKKDSRVIVINQENTGVGRARNNGIDQARGEFVCFLDPDDYYPANDVLEAMYTAARDSNVKICGGSFSKDVDGKIFTQYYDDLVKYTFEHDGMVRFSDYQFDYGFTRFIYDRKMLAENNIYFPAYIRFQDPPFFISAMVCAGEFYALKKVTYCYRKGHQKLVWHPRRVNDLVRGLTDDLAISREQGYSELHALTVWRFNNPYYKPIWNSLKENNMELAYLLVKANSLIDISLMKKEDANISDTYIMEPLRKMIAAGVNSFKSSPEANKDISRIKSSCSYKIGQFITFVPRNIVLLFKKLYQHGVRETLQMIRRKLRRG